MLPLLLKRQKHVHGKYEYVSISTTSRFIRVPINLVKWSIRFLKEQVTGPSGDIPFLSNLGRASWVLGLLMVVFLIFKEQDLKHLWFHLGFEIAPLIVFAIGASFFAPPENPQIKKKKKIEDSEEDE